MTYREFMRELSPDRDDVAFGVSLIGSVFTVLFLLCAIGGALAGSWEPIIALIAIFLGMLTVAAAVFAVGTFLFWVIAER
jgi:uncharacterized Tic20 family protein